MRLDADVVVIGGGVIGTAVTYYLSRDGRRVTLLERGELACGASGANPGGLSLLSKKPGPTLRMAVAGVGLYPDLGTELECDLEYERRGGVVLVETEREWQYMRQLAERQCEAGVPVETLAPEELRRLEPGLSPHLLGATYSAADASLNPQHLTLGFARAARRLGAEVLARTPVVGIEVQGGQVLGVRTADAVLRGSWVVNAAGAYAGAVGRMVGVEHPIVPQRGQQIVTEQRPGLVRTKMLGAGHVVHKHLGGVEGESPLGLGLSLVPSRRGGVLLGSTNEHAGEDTSATAEAVQAIAEYAGRILPALRGARVVRSWSGLRPGTPSGAPLLGAVDGPRGYLVAAGHGGDGTALAAITGRYLAAVVASDGKGPVLEKFLSGR